MSKVSINQKKNAIRLNWMALPFLLLVSTLTLGDETKAKIYFDIREQPLGAALIEFSEQADIQLMISTDLVEDLTSLGVRGRYLPTEALAVLLTGTGLAYQAVGARSIVLIANPDASSLPGESSSGCGS